MSDRMTIVGKDGEKRYLIDDEDRIIDLRICHCETQSQDAAQLVCPVCGQLLVATTP
jgi:hypothetical protein